MIIRHVLYLIDYVRIVIIPCVALYLSIVLPKLGHGHQFHQDLILLIFELQWNFLASKVLERHAFPPLTQNNKMMKTSAMVGLRPQKHLVLVGGGHSHAFVLKSLAMKPESIASVTLICDSYDTPYSGMLPGYVCGIYSREQCHLDLTRIAQYANVHFIIGRVCKIDREEKLVYVEDAKRPPVKYDVLSIDIGSSPTYLPIKTSSIRVTPVKPISNFNEGLNRIIDTVKSRFRENTMTKIAVIGGGAGGCEIALALRTRLDPFAKLVQIILFSREKVVCPSHHYEVQSLMISALQRRNIIVEVSAEITEIVDHELVSKKNRYSVDECILCTDAASQSWIKEAGFDVDNKGFIKVDGNLESTNTDYVFACGDCAYVVPYPRPKAGVFAVRQGPPLMKNLRAALNSEPLTEFKPQEYFLGIIGLGDGSAIATKGSLVLEGEWLWELKDWIDKNWMLQYQVFSSSMPFDDEPMQCAGCGSKVSANVLSKAMKTFQNKQINVGNDESDKKKDNIYVAHEVLVGLEDPDDCAIVRLDTSIYQVQTVDFFTSFINDPFLFGRITANHALSDCHAKGADAKTALAIVTINHVADNLKEDVLRQMMAGAIQTLNESGCILVGGHTMEGEKLALGFSINGLLPKQTMPLRKTEVSTISGHDIILTKGLGTGAILAAHMRNIAHGKWVDAAVRSMLISNRDAAFAIREKFSVSTCTDVTGFGLIGHLNEVLRNQEKVEAVIDVGQVPTLPGAVECSQLGVVSSLYPSNKEHTRKKLSSSKEALGDDKYPLLFDPQTAGGLLFTIDPTYTEECVNHLRSIGYPMASKIGHISSNTLSSIDGKNIIIR